jgi:cyclohexadieny/prephenate dehydrogenase
MGSPAKHGNSGPLSREAANCSTTSDAAEPGHVPFRAGHVKLVAVRGCSHRKGTDFRMRDWIAIVGVGLIGGSLAAAVKRRGVARRVLGIGRNPERLQGAQSAGLIDAWSTDSAAVRDAELTVVCTPVDRIANDVKSLWPDVPSSGLVTDAGSTKRRICEDLGGCRDGDREFVGSHPIAGSHRQGFEAADPELYAGRMCVVTPTEDSSPTAVDQIEGFWRAVGMRTVRLSPAEHDKALAATSHLPHLAAAALANTLETANRELIGTGFRDTTRIAAGDPDLWTAILLSNRRDVCVSLDALTQQVAAFRTTLERGDAAALNRLLKQAKTVRDSLE